MPIPERTAREDRPRVALTVDMDDEGLAAVIEAARPDYIQLHGGESPARAADIRRKFGLPLIRAIRVAEAADLEVCAEWDGLAEWLLFDAKGDPGGLPGGTGHSFDWNLLADHAGNTRWMLAGGLSVENVARAVTVTGAVAVDVSSGVESRRKKRRRTNSRLCLQRPAGVVSGLTQTTGRHGRRRIDHDRHQPEFPSQPAR